ncbi:MAG TPA: Re/Si-specific NAD(P)(+) transhydrogenase subunit alpha [Polyangiaceae bacterium]|nr:Re/Si-specific NAD(P)(+) transhydrogenase subunit alpha [Polyangiaceae bacterium]
MKIAIVRESRADERRVAATPDTVGRLTGKLGFEVVVESGAGDRAGFSDASFVQAGATIVEGTQAAWAAGDIVLKVQPPELVGGVHETDWLREGTTLCSFVWPSKSPELLQRLNERRVTALAMDAVPRISRAQKLDALSSMANISGYRAIVEAAGLFGRFFTGQMTAAGKVPPAKVLVIGAGVAGLAAIGAARSLGAIVRAFDTRPAVKEQVESMGAEFLMLDFAEDGTGQGGYAKVMSDEFIKAEMALFLAQAKDVDIIVTTALIPGRPAPKLIDDEMVAAMKPGSVIVDLAAEAGGNCTATVPGQVVDVNGVKVAGFTDLPSRMAPTASQLYGMNLVHLLTDMGGAPNWRVDFEDEVVRGATVTHEGAITWPPPPAKHPVEAAKKVEAAPKKEGPSPAEKARANARRSTLTLVGIGALLGLLGYVAPAAFVAHLTVFVLACFIGWQVVWNVTAALHTPLMSVTNAISGIIIVGGMLQISGASGQNTPVAQLVQSPVTILGALAILLATINIAGGFLVTQRMLKMFTR